MGYAIKSPVNHNGFTFMRAAFFIAFFFIIIIVIIIIVFCFFFFFMLVATPRLSLAPARS